MSDEIELQDVFALPWIPIQGYRGLPVRPGVYFVLSHENAVLYVGRSRSIRKRWAHHERLQEFLPMPGIRVAWFAVEDTELLAHLEEAYITALKPLHNGRRIQFVRYDFEMRPAAYRLSSFGERIRFRREQSGFSLEELAQAASLSFSRLESIEQGEYEDPRLTEIIGLARALVVTADWLIGMYKPYENPWPLGPIK